MRDLFNCTERSVEEKIKVEKRRLAEEVRAWEERRVKEEEAFKNRNRKIEEIEKKLVHNPAKFPLWQDPSTHTN